MLDLLAVEGWRALLGLLDGQVGVTFVTKTPTSMQYSFYCIPLRDHPQLRQNIVWVVRWAFTIIELIIRFGSSKKGPLHAARCLGDTRAGLLIRSNPLNQLNV